MNECAIASCKADDDAGRLMVTTAISLAEELKRVILVGGRHPLSWLTASFQLVFFQTWKRKSTQRAVPQQQAPPSIISWLSTYSLCML
ncbi:hypothetical protein JTB14_030297 [Gonioctena quinquepunctata]|nr:hypothetical protein JTB14_030297 [Gonioctena quinquepunctata]